MVDLLADSGLSTGALSESTILTSHLIELDHGLVCEMTWHPAHDPCDERTDYKIYVFDATCGVWWVRVTCTGCAGAWVQTIEGCYCSCSSVHATHELGRFHMEPIR